MTKVKLNEIIEKLKKGENVGFLDNSDMRQVAVELGADTSVADRLIGRGSIADTLIDAIEKRLDELKTEALAT